MSEVSPTAPVALGFGDSVAHGLRSFGREGWMRRLQTAYYERSDGGYRTFYDLTVVGETMRSFHDRVVLREEALSRQRSGVNGEARRCTSIVSVGGQDVALSALGQTEQTPEARAERYLRPALAELLRLGDVLYVGMPLPNETIWSQRLREVQGIDISPEELRSGERIRGLETLVCESLLPSLRDEYPDRQCIGVPLTYRHDPNEPLRVIPNFIHRDGIHPSDEGYDNIVGRIIPAFRRLVFGEDVAI